MNEDNVVQLRHPGDFDDSLTDVLRQGARKMLVQAVEAEVASFLEATSGHLSLPHVRRAPIRRRQNRGRHDRQTLRLSGRGKVLSFRGSREALNENLVETILPFRLLGAGTRQSFN
jgi:hypothetical protein